MTSMSIILTAVAAFTVTVMLCMVCIPVLRRLKFGQSIREDGPTWHKAKEGIPTMGGIAFTIGISIAVLLGYFILTVFDLTTLETEETIRLFGGLLMAVLFGLIGFLDDYIKVVKKRNLGLKAGQKIILQILVTSAFLAANHFLLGQSTVVNIPFLGAYDFGYLYYPFMGILMIFIVNSVNLTDGVDGLASSVTFVAGIFFMAATTYLSLTGLNLFATALAAGCLGFLMFNAHPAKIFMGDTGSFFLGGAVLALAFGIKMELILLVVGLIYCIESLSVILQVISFKTTGKRIFRMSPIHHHFEMGGWKETKIVFVFSVITILMGVIAFLAVTKV